MGQVLKPVVLLVEDEPLTRMGARMALEDVGCEVLDAADAEAALGLVRDRADIAVMVTDIRMPGLMDGLMLARVVSTLRPDVRIIITSGGLRRCADDLPGEVAFLPKPYAVDGLARRLASTGGR